MRTLSTPPSGRTNTCASNSDLRLRFQWSRRTENQASDDRFAFASQ